MTLGMQLEERLLGHMVTLCLKFCATPKLFSKAIRPFCIALWSECLLPLKTHMLKSSYHRDGLGRATESW